MKGATVTFLCNANVTFKPGVEGFITEVTHFAPMSSAGIQSLCGGMGTGLAIVANAFGGYIAASVFTGTAGDSQHTTSGLKHPLKSGDSVCFTPVASGCCVFTVELS